MMQNVVVGGTAVILAFPIARHFGFHLFPTWPQIMIAIGGILMVILLVLAIDIARRKRHDIYTRDCNPIWGHVVQLLKTQETRHDEFYNILCKIANDASLSTMTFSSIMPFHSPIIFTVDPRNVEHILKTDFANYEKGRAMHEHAKLLLGDGIFNVDGALWKKQRKITALIFTINNYKNFMLPIFNQHMGNLISVLDSSAETQEPIDLHDHFHRFTLHSLLAIGFGLDVDYNGMQAFSRAFDTAQAIISKRIPLPKALTNVVEWINGDGKRLIDCVATLDDFIYRVIASRKSDSERASKNDLLSRFMHTKNPDTDKKFTDQELRDIILNLMIAGRDTTAQALSWTIYLLAQHPDVVTSMRAEISTLCPRDVNEPLTFQLLNHDLVYVRAVFSEALRFYPSVPQEIKYAITDDMLPDGTKIRAGDNLVWSPWCMGRLPELWGPDALEFKPARWLDMDVHPGPYKYPVFNAGPRVCLGQQMAYLEATSCLVALVRRFDFELVDPASIVYSTALTLPMKNGLRIRTRYAPQRIPSKYANRELVHNHSDIVKGFEE